jgi:hypothetical protein
VPHRISEFIISIIDYIPALFLEQDSPNFRVVRAMSTLIVVALLVAVFALIGHFRFKVAAYVRSAFRKPAPGAADSGTPRSDMGGRKWP